MGILSIQDNPLPYNLRRKIMAGRKTIYIIAVLLLATMMSSACVKKYGLTLGKVFELDSEKIIKGKTSKTEIISKLGTPSMVLNPAGGKETIVYAYNSGDKQAFEIGLLVIVLNEKGIVDDYYCGLQSSSAEDKKIKTSGLPLTKDSIALINKLLASNEPYEKISAVTLALGKFDSAELGFLQEYIKANLPDAKDAGVRLCYLAALSEITGDSSYLNQVTSVLDKDPDLLSSFKDRNLMLYSLIIDTITSGCENGDPAVLKFVYSHLDMNSYKEAFSSKINEIFSNSFNPSLKVLEGLDSETLKTFLSLADIKQDMNDINYLRLNYYFLSGSKEYAPVSKKILELLNSK
jgi:outer membrane protein assembly factor BamE (lipoprotein component of BamABCDE complex)